MTLSECYEELGGDYGGVLSRMSSEKLVQKFTLKFLDDKSFDLLKKSLDENQYEEAFRAAHTIKGICQNLGFARLYTSDCALTEALRNKTYDGIDNLFADTAADYRTTVSAIERYRKENGL
jgi:HPt (histidine-containing phosphotransfer) domain-containing protein